MLLKKKGFPQEGELVLCTVTNIHFHSVFVSLDEYGKSGMVHISEISPGRIRNIRDFVVEGKMIVCKVLSIKEDKGHIDLSLRRVSENQKRLKVEENKKEQKVEKIIEFLAKELKLDLEKVFFDIYDQVIKKYESIHDAFEEISLGNSTVEKIGIDPKYSKDLAELIKQRVKPPQVAIRGVYHIKSYDSDGVTIIKDAFNKALKKVEDVSLMYGGAGRYNVVVTSLDYKDAEKTLKNFTDTVEKNILKCGGTFIFDREKTK